MKVTNYRAKLEEILENSSGVTGAFSYSRTHAVSPNPGIDVDGFGALGLPLSAREALALKDWASKESSEKEGGAVEISANKVRFSNPEWDTFVKRAARDVCNELGVPSEASQPRCELTKLLVRASGTRLNVPSPADANANAFASLIIILPSKFTGSTLCIAHDGRSETYAYSKAPPTSTTVLAWYAGVSTTFAPVTDGHQLALLYTVMHAPPAGSPSPTPTLASQAGVVVRLRALLAQWKEAKQKGFPVPTQAIYLLGGKYPHASDSDSAAPPTPTLNDADARAVALLHNVGKLEGFRTGLARLTITVRGYGENKGCADGDETEEEDWDDIRVVPDNTQVEIEGIVGLDGARVLDTVAHNLEKEGIPANMVAVVTEQRQDKQYFTYNFDDIAFKRVYFRTVAVFSLTTVQQQPAISQSTTDSQEDTEERPAKRQKM